jgi:hypothetical protein
MPDQTRGQLAATIREAAIRLHWHDQHGQDRKALNEVSKLLVAATMYEQCLIESVGFLPCRGN